jgi:hypothetical protein
LGAAGGEGHAKLTRYNYRRRYPRPTPQRIVAWWDVDVELGSFHKRKMTMRPLKALERVLGHRLRVEGWEHHHMTKGVYKFHAYNNLDTTDPDLALSFVLRQLAKVTQSVGNSGYRVNRAAALTDDFDDAVIGAFYWAPPEQIDLPNFKSSGVLLSLAGRRRLHGRAGKSTRPIVKIPQATGGRADNLIDITIHIFCSDKQALIEHQLPDFLYSHWPDGIELVEMDAHTHAGQPNIIRVRQAIPNALEHEAVGACLAISPGFNFQLGQNEPFSFSGHCHPSAHYSDGIVAVELTRVRQQP